MCGMKTFFFSAFPWGVGFKGHAAVDMFRCQSNSSMSCSRLSTQKVQLEFEESSGTNNWTY